MSFWKKPIIIIVILIGLVLLFNSVIMPWYVKHDTLVKVPSVIGLTFPEAQKVLDEAGLEAKQGDIRYDPSKPLGTIMEQNPPAEHMVKAERRIYLIISGGEQLYDVPNLVGRSVREARFSLSQRNLQLLEVNFKPSVRFPSGIIIEQIETPGSKVKKGTNIGVVVSAGMESGNIKVPDLIGKDIEEAKKIILQNKLAIGKINSQPSATVPLNSIIDQYPKANTMAQENQKIDLFVNRVVKKKVIPEEDEEFKPETESENRDIDKESSKPKDTDKIKESDKKQDIKKEKEDKSKPIDRDKDKKEDKQKSKKPVEKDKDIIKDKDVKKEKDENKDDGGTKF